MIRYFEANIDGADRIAVVTGDTADAIFECPEASHREIAADELPEGFADWKRYTAHAYSDAMVQIVSPDGD